MARTTRKKEVSIQDWLGFKPYKKYDNYDVAYLKLAREIQTVLEPIKDFFYVIDVEEDEQILLIACIVTSYVEDFISEIGLWKALVQQNQERLGVPIPFFDTDDYDTEYLNPADFSFLIWHTCSIYAELPLSPSYPFFAYLGHELYELCEPKIDDLPATDYYDKYLQVSINEAFPTVHNKLIWMQKKSYLIGWASMVLFQQELLDNVNEAIERGDKIPPNAAVELDNETLIQESVFHSLHAAEWLSLIVRGEQSTKKAIANLKQVHYGIYEVVEATPETVHLKHINTKQNYQVYFPVADLNKVYQQAACVEAQLVAWHEKWFAIGFPLEIIDDPDLRTDYHESNELHTYMLNKTQEALREKRLAYARSYFEQYFESPLVVFKNMEEASSQLIEFYAFVDPKMEEPPPLSTASFYDRAPKIFSEGEHIKNIGMFCSPSGKINILVGITKLLEELEANSKEKEHDFYVKLSHFAYLPGFLHYIKSYYGEKSLRPSAGNEQYYHPQLVCFIGTYYWERSGKIYSPLPLWKYPE
ncbi:MAG: DUF3843 family protein [Bacteroidota bacterium]